MPKPSAGKQTKPATKFSDRASSTASSLATRAASDPRFASLSTDPRFRLPSKKHARVQLDKRFAHLLKDDDFARKATVDRYGRKINSDEGKKRLERFYRIGDDEDEAEADASDQEEESAKGKGKRAARSYDPARDGGFSSSESDSDEEDVDEAELGEEEGVLPAEANAYLHAEQSATGGAAAQAGEVTRRLAIVNLDWDNIRAVDIMAVAHSFCPTDGQILDVTVYPSEFGKERMQREEREGPPAELFRGAGRPRPDPPKGGDLEAAAATAEDDDDDETTEDEDDGDDDEAIRKSLLPTEEGEDGSLDPHALRNYQLMRLRYYYAVMTCNTAQTGQALYNEMDGREYLTSANFFDLRFVPDETDFADDTPRDKCTKVPTGYRPNDFTTEALTHSKVKLTWDADNEKERIEVRKRAFGNGEMAEEDIRAYLGSDSSDSEASDEETAPDQKGEKSRGPTESKAEEARRKMRAALGLPVDEPMKAPSKKDKAQGGMQITFTPGLSATQGEKRDVFENKPEDVIEETTIEKYRRKEKERKARRKAKTQASRDGVPLDEAEESAAGDDGNEIEDATDGAAQNKDEEDPFNDPFFTDPAAANAAAKKEAKRRKRAEALAMEKSNAEKTRREKEQLELLMADSSAPSHHSHFNMDEVRRAEKMEARKGKKIKKSKRDKAAEGKVDGFEVDAADERFKNVFESHEYAIDPSNPKFSGTKGMKKLLEEGRRKRKGDIDSSETGQEVRGEDGIQDLVRKVKKRKT